MTAWLLAIARMLGLGTTAGLRPSLTLAVVGVVSNLDIGVGLNPTFSFLHHWAAIVILVVLAMVESGFDKIDKVDRLQDRLLMPYRLFMGAVAGACTIPFGLRGVVAGAVVGCAAAWFAQYTKHRTRPKSVPSEAVTTLLSLAEDLATFGGSVVTLAVPYSGYLGVIATAAFYTRLRRRRQAKYRQFRHRAEMGRQERLRRQQLGASPEIIKDDHE